MAKELKFDIEELRKMKNKLGETASDLDSEKEEVLKGIDELKEHWETPAGKKFIEEVDLGWADEVDRYIRIIEGVQQLLDEAIKEYEKVVDKVDRLKFYS